MSHAVYKWRRTTTSRFFRRLEYQTSSINKCLQLRGDFWGCPYRADPVFFRGRGEALTSGVLLLVRPRREVEIARKRVPRLYGTREVMKLDPVDLLLIQQSKVVDNPAESYRPDVVRVS